MAQYVSEENLKQYDKLLKEYIQTKSESLLDLLSYGVRWEKGQKDPHLTRIGNLEWHRTLPLQSQMRGCIVQSPSKGIHIVKYWLHPDDWRFRKDNAGYIFNSEVSTIVENDITYYTITDSTRFSDLGYKRQYVKINGIIGQIIDITDNTAKIKLESTLDAGTYEIELGSRTNGYDGEVMVYMPGGYLHSVDAPTYSEVRISPFNVGGDWEYHKPGYISAYRITVLNKVPTDMGYLSTIPVNSAISVANVETYCRGGGNRPEYDQYLETDPFRSDLGKGIYISQTNARTYARNCNNELLSYFNYKWLVWLYIIEYANFNSQEEFNLELTTEGYKQGGVGGGFTSLPYSYITIYNNLQQICPNGYLSENGNTTNIKEFNINLPTTSEETEYKSYTQYPFSYRGIENVFGDTYIGLEGIIVKSLTHTIGEDKYHTAYITNNPEYYSNTLENKEIAGSIYATNVGLIKEFDLKNTANIFPISVNNISYTTYKCDSVWAQNTMYKLRGIVVGGPSYYGVTCGLLFFNANNSANLYTYFRSFKELSMESIVITSDSNAPLMTAMYNAGLASNPDYMTKSEAEKVTTLEGIDFTNVVSFDEFKYFTGVTEIPNQYFLKNTSLTSIICPDSLITIGDQAFSTCSNLSYIKIGKYVTSIGRLAFAACSKLTNVIIPNFVTSIGSSAFQYSGLKSIKLSNSLTSISPYMFRECSLTSVIIPDSVTTIGNYAFYSCNNLISIKIGNSVTSIGSYAFNNCYKLASIEIPDSVTTIGDYSFVNCDALKNITIGNSVTSIGNRVFNDCSSLESINVKSGNTVYDSRNNCNAIIKTATNTLIKGCKNTIIPDSVTSIGEYAFNYCDNLTQITIPNSVTSIGWATFEGCRHLTSLKISKYVTLINGQITASCTSLSEIIVEEGNPNYDSRDNCNAIIETSTNKLISACKNTIIPNTVTTIDSYAFYGHSTLTSIVIPKSITAINAHAFYSCRGLSSITCLALTAPTVSSISFGRDNWSYTGRNTYDQGVNKLYIPAGATGYDTGAWLDPLQNAEKCGFTIELLYAVKRETNPELMDICVANGWSANKDYMTFKEAAAITSDMIAPNEEDESKFSTLTHFEEFQYFTGVKEIKDSTFYDCESLTSIIIPDSVTLIGNDAFGECYELINITIPSSVTSIGNSAFYDCSSLTTINIPNSITSISGYTFSECYKLTSITIPNSVTSIGESAFDCCSSLTSINIPNSITTIGNSAFNSCDSLTSITIPDSVTSIGESAFEGCSGLESIVVDNGNSKYYSKDNAIIETDTNTLIVGCKNTIIPDSVTSIGNGAFYDCDGLTSINIPDSVTSIGNNVFSFCTGLTSIIIPNSVTSIGDSTFQNCSRLTSIEIPDSVTSIGSSAFYNCDSLTSVTISNSITSISDRIFYGCTNLTSIIIPDSVISINNYAFCKCSSLTNIVIPDSVTSIGDEAFYDCSSLTSVQFNAENCSDLSEYYHWLSGCNNITSFTFGENVKTIPASLCYKLTKLTSVVIPDLVTSIGESAFDGCSSLTSVSIGNSVTSIGNYAFYNCSILTSVTIGNSVTSIGEYAFFGCTSMTSVLIPNSVTSIGMYAFYNCSNLTSIDIPNLVTNIGKYAFFGCRSLTSIDIPNSVRSIGQRTFNGCSSLTSVTIGNSVTEIGEFAFDGCSRLTSIEIPNSVTSLGNGAFWNCSGLSSIIIPDSVTSIGNNAFSSCSSLYSITCLAATAPTVESSTFGDLYFYTGHNTYNQGINKLKVPAGATGYDTGYWKDPLQNSSKCGFTIEYI